MRSTTMSCGGILILLLTMTGLFAEDPPMDLFGRWTSQDEAKIPLQFDKDGAFQTGVYRKRGKWRMAKGKFTWNDDGTIKTEAVIGSVTLTSRYQFKDGKLNGAHEDNPQATWEKAAE